MKLSSQFLLLISFLKLAIAASLFFAFLPQVLHAQANSQSYITDSLEIERLTGHLRMHFRQRQSDSARIYADSIYQLAERAGMKQKIADCYHNYALIERISGNPEAFISNQLQAAKIYMQLNAQRQAANAYTHIGQVYVDQRDYEAAYDYFINSLNLREQIKDSLGIANNLINIGNLLYINGRLADASKFFFRALRIADQLDNNTLVATILLNVSNVLMQQRNYDKAIEYLQQAKFYHQAAANPKGESDALMNLGIIYYELGDLDTAFNYLQEALQIKEELKTDLPGLIKVFNNLGLIAKEKGDDATAINYYSETLKLSRQSGDKHTEAIALSNLGARMMVKGDTASLPLLLESLELAQELGLKRLFLNIYDNLQQYYSQFGGYEKAYHYALRYQAMNDSLFNEESAVKIIELQTKYDTEMKEKENEILRNQANILRLRISVLVISVAALTMLAVLFIILFGLKRKSLFQSRLLFEKEQELHRVESEKINRENKHLNEVLFAEEQINKYQREQLNEKNRELTASTLHIVNKNEVLGNIRNLALKVLNGEVCDKKTCIEKLISEVDSNMNLDEQWEIFKKHFESVHTGFFNRLLEKYPSLTQNELKLCAYLRMNLSSKEIGRMLNIGMDSVATKRYRLRKKLQLKGDDNLVTFLSGH